MYDLKQLIAKKETIVLEAKRAAGGLPHSIWETYSAFANTLGGIILLGVEETPDHNLHLRGVIDGEEMRRHFWRMVKNPMVANRNILSKNDVTIQREDGMDIIVIEVPKASRHDKPIYIGGDRRTGTYRRSGDGDYRCTEEEIADMLRDSAEITPDTTVLEQLELSAFDRETIWRYYNRLRDRQPEHPLLHMGEDEFFRTIGVAKKLRGGFFPTAAGLLVFGKASAIRSVFPQFSLRYFELTQGGGEYRLLSCDPSWSGNLYDFYLQVSERITGGIPENDAVYAAIREALANALIHANYYNAYGVVVKKVRMELIFANGGGLLPQMNEAVWKGSHEPRNPVIAQIFALVGIGQNAGSSMAKIRSGLMNAGYPAPVWQEAFTPERTITRISLDRVEEREMHF